MVDQKNPDHVPYWITIIGPLVTLIVIAIFRSELTYESFDQWIMSEQGLVELGTAIVLLASIPIGIMSINRNKGIVCVVASVFTLCAVYFLGEEISWGQHIFGWETPESFRQLNDQQETNFHNMSSWLDQKPRILLELWVFLLAAAGALGFLKRHPWMFARGKLWFVALLAILCKFPERLMTYMETPVWFHFRLSEVQEWMFSWVFFAYLWFLWRGDLDHTRAPSTEKNALSESG